MNNFDYYNQAPNDFSNSMMTGNAPNSMAPQAAASGDNTGTGMAIGAGLGLLSALGKQKAYQARMKQLETTTRFSPWTHMSMAQPDAPNALGDIVGLGAAGGAQGQGNMADMAKLAMMAG